MHGAAQTAVGANVGINPPLPTSFGTFPPYSSVPGPGVLPTTSAPVTSTGTGVLLQSTSSAAAAAVAAAAAALPSVPVGVGVVGFSSMPPGHPAYNTLGPGSVFIQPGTHHAAVVNQKNSEVDSFIDSLLASQPEVDEEAPSNEEGETPRKEKQTKKDEDGRSSAECVLDALKATEPAEDESNKVDKNDIADQGLNHKDGNTAEEHVEKSQDKQDNAKNKDTEINLDAGKAVSSDERSHHETTCTIKEPREITDAIHAAEKEPNLDNDGEELKEKTRTDQKMEDIETPNPPADLQEETMNERAATTDKDINTPEEQGEDADKILEPAQEAVESVLEEEKENLDVTERKGEDVTDATCKESEPQKRETLHEAGTSGSDVQEKDLESQDAAQEISENEAMPLDNTPSGKDIHDDFKDAVMTERENESEEAEVGTKRISRASARQKRKRSTEKHDESSPEKGEEEGNSEQMETEELETKETEEELEEISSEISDSADQSDEDNEEPAPVPPPRKRGRPRRQGTPTEDKTEAAIHKSSRQTSSSRGRRGGRRGRGRGRGRSSYVQKVDNGREGVTTRSGKKQADEDKARFKRGSGRTRASGTSRGSKQRKPNSKR